MSALDKAKNKAEELGGKVKEKTGQATGDHRLEAEGNIDQTSGNLKQAGEKVKDVFKDCQRLNWANRQCRDEFRPRQVIST